MLTWFHSRKDDRVLHNARQRLIQALEDFRANPTPLNRKRVVECAHAHKCAVHEVIEQSPDE